MAWRSEKLHGISIEEHCVFKCVVPISFDERIYSDTQIPETVLVSVIGKSPLDIIQGHPDIDARYTADDRIVAARWYPDAEVTGFDVVRSR